MLGMSQVSVYYDGLCKVCAWEMSHYQRNEQADRIRFVDISSPNFDAKSENLDPFLVHKVMHAKDKFGHLHTRVDAFVLIWQTLPSWNWLAQLAQKNWARPVLDLGYWGFTQIRPYLPRYKESCGQSAYCETHQNKT